MVLRGSMKTGGDRRATQGGPKTNADPGSGIGVGESESVSEREETAVRSIEVLSFGVVLGAVREERGELFSAETP